MFTANAEETGHFNTQQSIIVLHYSFLASYSSDTRLQKSMFTNGFVKFNDRNCKKLHRCYYFHKLIF